MMGGKDRFAAVRDIGRYLKKVLFDHGVLWLLCGQTHAAGGDANR
jgi:hypothetical protein